MAWVNCVTGDPPGWADGNAERGAGPVVIALSIAGLVEPSAALLDWLTTDEQQRAGRYRHIADRLRFLYGRSLLRWVGAGLTGVPARAVALPTGPYGKPDFAPQTGWHGNLAHAGDWVLLAIDRQPVGIDVEAFRADLPIDTLLPAVCSAAEQAYVRASAEPVRAFLRLWTRKEALLKATGRGLIDSLSGVPALDGAWPVPAGLTTDDTHWQTVGFDVDEAHLAALTYQPASGLPRFYQRTASDLLTTDWQA